MSKYENGESTRQAILDAAKRLFYYNSYEATSMDDICREAHVRRSSIYYHFKNKDQILNQVLIDIVKEYELLAEQYCDIPEYIFTLSMAIIWQLFLHDDGFRKMHLQWAKNNPMYSPDNQVFSIHLLCYQRSTDQKLDVEQVRELSAASAYGLLIYILNLAAGRYDVFTAEELVQHCMSNIGRLYHLEEFVVEKAWNDILPYIRKLPLESLKKLRIE